MKADSQLTRQAWVDDQLPLDEVIRLEESLTADERRSLERERAFEKALGEAMRQGPGCPDSLWERVRGELRQSPPETLPVVPFWRRWQRPALAWAAAAAVAAVLGVVFWPKSPPQLPPFMTTQFSANPAIFAADAEVPGNLDKMRASLDSEGIHLALQPIPNGHHAITPLGLHMTEYHGEKVAVLYFSCCGQPMMALVSKSGSLDAAHLPLQQLPPGTQLAMREIDGYRVMVFGPHDTAELMALLG